MPNQRLLLYFSLILVLYLIWQAWQQDYGLLPSIGDDRVAEGPAVEETAPAGGPAETPANRRSDDIPDVPPSAPSGADVPPAPAAPSAPTDRGGQQIRVYTDVLEVIIDTRGGDIRQTELPAYPAEADTPDVPFRLLREEPVLYVAQSGLVSAGTDGGADPDQLAPSHHALYEAQQTEYRLAEGIDTLRVPLAWRGKNGVTITKTFAFQRGEYLIGIEHRVRNNGGQPWSGRQYRQLRHGAIPGGGPSLFFIYTYTGGAYYDDAYEKIDFEAMAEEQLNREITGGWAAVMQHYFVSAWIPKPGQPNFYYTMAVPGAEGPEYIIGLRSPAQTIAPGEAARFESQLFAGPKLQERLDDIATGLELVVDYGIFTFIAKPLFWLLDWIHSWIGNWGWAIIIVTILIKLAFYKLSETSYRSMARMRKVQPRLMALRERYADDKQRMNQALMELYKKEKINPLGGCLPIIIQIPVFIALYWVLLESVELRQADFMLWIDDLSSKDPYFVLPILMGATMYAQQKLNPAPLDPVQAKVFMLLPFIFTAFFAFFPAGLVLYWFVNNLLSIAQQWLITKRIEQGAEG